MMGGCEMKRTLVLVLMLIMVFATSAMAAKPVEI